MKKILVLIVLLGLSGCSVEYNLNITGDEFQEEIIIDDNGFDFDISAYQDQPDPQNGDYSDIETYNATINDNLSILSYDFNKDDFRDSNAANVCFRNLVVNEDDGVMTLLTTDFSTCMDYYTNIDDITVNISLDREYVSVNHNADTVRDNVYTWNITRDNLDGKYIYLAYQGDSCNISCGENQELINPDSADCYCVDINEEDSNWFNYILIASVLAVFIIAIWALIKYRSMKSMK